MDGRLFEASAYSRLGAYSNKHGICVFIYFEQFTLKGSKPVLVKKNAKYTKYKYVVFLRGFAGFSTCI